MNKYIIFIFYIIILMCIMIYFIYTNNTNNTNNINNTNNTNKKFINYINYYNNYLENNYDSFILAPFSIKKIMNIDRTHINNVPLNIYITWENRELPYNMYKNLYMLSLINPEFNIYLYDSNDRLAFLKEHFDKNIVDAYNSLIPGAFKADLWKYAVIYKLGGIYMDIKYINHYSLISLIMNNSVHFAEQKTDVCKDPTIINAIMSGFFISPPNNPIFLHTLNEIVIKCKNKNYGNYVTDITGPCVLTRNINKLYNYDFSKLTTMSWDATDNDDFFYIKNTNILVLSRYKEYRNDQFNFFKNNLIKDYREAWKNKEVFTM